MGTISATPPPVQQLASISVLCRRETRAWPRHADAPQIATLALGDALTRSYATDAHLAAYVSPVGRRLSTDAIGRVSIAVQVIVLDVDCLSVHGAPLPAPAAWRALERSKLDTLAADHPGVYAYDTRGGYRVVYRLPAAVPIASPGDAHAWRRRYLATCAHLDRAYGVAADRACADWTRLYRAPCVVRDGMREKRATYGDPHAVGVLAVELVRADLAAADAQLRPSYVPPLAEVTCAGATGRGLLYRLLAARGAILRERDAKSFVVRCPRAARHTCGDGSALLYVARPGGEIGAIKCLHTHCVGLRVSDWLREFTRGELESARVRAW